MPIINQCLICKKSFPTKLFYVRKGQGKFCSSKCKHEASRTGKTVQCSQCGKDVYRKPRHLKNSQSGKYFCDKSCQTIWRNSEFVGEKHTNWTNGMYAYRSVLTRHKVPQICRLCKTKDPRILAVHHIDKNRKNNEVDNLAWLCHNCHHLVHHYDRGREALMAAIV